MATAPLTQTTGRRKEAVARAQLRPGTGQFIDQRQEPRGVLPDGRVADGRVRGAHRHRHPRDLRHHASIHGGGISGQAGALRMAIARSLLEIDPESRPVLKKAGLLTRDSA